jgi:hypothetical protein
MNEKFTMKRRKFLSHTMLLGASGLAIPTARLYAADSPDYQGPLLATLQIEGGWDVTSYCDPKENQAGEPVITNWSMQNQIQTAGNIGYAPIVNNQWFFEKYHQDLLVINGIDAQTNSHTTGVLHNWSGRNAAGFPSLAALFAAHNAPNLPISYINFGGFSATSGLIRFSRLNDIAALRTLLDPGLSEYDPNQTDRSAEDLSRIARYRRDRIARLLSKPDSFGSMRTNLEAMDAALQNRASITRLKDFLPQGSEVAQQDQVNSETRSSLRRQIQATISGFQSGLCCASDLIVHGFDTHTNHDELHQPLFTHVNESIDMLWTEAEARGLADRLTLVIGSDFGRTPFYNSDNGKDHWPIGSVMVMQKNPAWGNRTIGSTDAGHNAYAISPASLQRDDANGSIIYPKHVHQAIRSLLGIDDIARVNGFGFTNSEDFDFFHA